MEKDTDVHEHAGHDLHASHDLHTGHNLHTGHDMRSGHGGRGLSAGEQDHSAHDHSAHDHSGHVERFRRLFWIMLVFAVPTIAFSPMFAGILGYSLPDAAVVAWISPVLGSVMYFWGRRPFLTGAWSELKARKPGMMLLIGLAITVAYFASLGASSVSSTTTSTSGGSSHSSS